MTTFVKTGTRISIILSLTSAAMIAPKFTLARPGCMSNKRMA